MMMDRARSRCQMVMMVVLTVRWLKRDAVLKTQMKVMIVPGAVRHDGPVRQIMTVREDGVRLNFNSQWAM